MKIRTRLTLLFVLLVASILLLFSGSVYYLYEQFRQHEFEQRLQEKALITIRLHDKAGVKRTSNDGLTLYNEQITVYDANGNVVYSQWPERGQFPVTTSFFSHLKPLVSQYLQHDDLEAVAIQYPTKQRGICTIIVSGNDRYGFSKLERLRQILFFGLLLCLIFVGIMGYLFATDALRPISELILQVNAISATNIHERLSVGRQRDELADLADTFNDLLSRLEEAFISQKSFVSHASHELRTPLTVMMGQIEVTRFQARSGSEYETTLDALLDEVKSMIRLVNGLLELARANADASMIRYKPVRIDELLWQVQSQIQLKKNTYQVDIDFENFPENEDELTIEGEESLLQTAIQNLLENGCKYSPDEHVTARLLFARNELQLTISDRGHGIPATDLPHIFEPFYRSQATMTVQGHGIGLALAWRIIKLHRGQLTVESTVGQGTTFRITLPTAGSLLNRPKNATVAEDPRPDLDLASR